jgi:nucleotidyltransferase substrate binding protein (TIGR01987 family)
MSRLIDLSSLSKAIAQLEEALVYAASDLAASDPRLALHLRAAAIQAFEFTYELSFKTLRRYLADTDPSPKTIETLDFSGLVRTGFARGLLNEEIAVWRKFREDRGTTSHAYDNDKAQDVFDHIPKFLAEAKFLRDRIEARQTEAS